MFTDPLLGALGFDDVVVIVSISVSPLAISLVSAKVPADAGRVTVTSAVAAGPISVTAFVPLSVSSLNRIEPAAVPEPVSMGAVKDLFVRVCEPVKVVTVESMLSVTVSVAPATDASPVPPAIVTVSYTHLTLPTIYSV